MLIVSFLTQPPRKTTALPVKASQDSELLMKPVITVVESKPEKPVKGMYKQFANKFAAKAGMLFTPIIKRWILTICV